MTKRLEELFDLPTDDDVSDEESIDSNDEAEEQKPPQEITMTAMSNLEKIDDALPAIKGLESADEEMDEIAKMAIDSYKDLMDLGMNVEARVANDILNSASNFLGHAITARDAKIRKKLKMIELQLRKAKLDQDRGDEPETTGSGEIVDRNELLRHILAQEKEKGDDDKKR